MRRSIIRDLTANDGHLTEEGTASYIDALRTDTCKDLPDSILEHVSECESCKADIVGTMSLILERPIEKEELVSSRRYLDDRTRWKAVTAYRIAAVLLVGVGIGTLILFFNHGEGDRAALLKPRIQDQAQRIEPRETSGPEALFPDTLKSLAGNFDVSPNLENLASSELRSSSIEVRSPRFGSAVGPEILFEWSGEEEGPFTIDVITNRDSTIYTEVVAARRLLFKGKLARGVYYWKLANERDLLYVGKFVVNQESN